MQLYDYCRSSAAYRVRIALNLKELNYQHIPVNLLESMQQSDEYKQTNPQGLVPSLIDGEVVLNQSLAICEYLDEVYPECGTLLPKDVVEKATVKAFALSIACDIHPLNNLRVLKYLTGQFGISEQQKTDWYHHWIIEGFTALEEKLSETAGEFCFGNSPTLADVVLVPQVFNAKRFNVPMDKFPTLNKVVENCDNHPAFIKAHPNNQPDS